MAISHVAEPLPYYMHTASEQWVGHGMAHSVRAIYSASEHVKFGRRYLPEKVALSL